VGFCNLDIIGGRSDFRHGAFDPVPSYVGAQSAAAGPGMRVGRDRIDESGTDEYPCRFSE
jgi:hypothetical protein